MQCSHCIYPLYHHHHHHHHLYFLTPFLPHYQEVIIIAGPRLRNSYVEPQLHFIRKNV